MRCAYRVNFTPELRTTTLGPKQAIVTLMRTSAGSAVSAIDGGDAPPSLSLESQPQGHLHLSRIAYCCCASEACSGRVGIRSGPEGSIWDQVVPVVQRIKSFGDSLETETL